MTNYDSTARVPFKRGGGVSGTKLKQVKEGAAKTKAGTKKGLEFAKELYKKSPFNFKGAAEGYKRLGKKAIEKIKKHKKKIKTVVKIASYGSPITWGYHAREQAKKFRDKKKK